METAPAAPRAPLAGRAVWRSRDLDERDWVVHLTPDQRHAIVDATRGARARGVTARSIDATSFPLPTVTDEIARWSAELERGLGFMLLRNFPIDLMSDDDVELAYIGLGSHFGTPVGQNAAGDLLTHIRDERLPEGGPKVRLYRTRERQDFHTDGADVIGLLCRHTALRGGESRIASSGAVYNEMLTRRPDLLEELYQPLCWDRQNDHAPGEQPWFRVAPVRDVDRVPRIFYIGWYIRDAQQHPDVPRLTTAQVEAMKLLESIANDPLVHLEMDFVPGDVQLLNNGRILHSREAYEDAEDPAQRRHLLRLWLAAHTFASLEDGLRRGVNAAAR